jgi:hypothetical protein
MTMGCGLLPSCLVVALLRACATSSEEALRARLQAAASSRSTWSPTAPPRDGAAPPLNLTASLRRRGAHAGAGAPRDADVLVAVLLSGDVSEFARAPRPSAWPRRVEAALDFFVALESTLGAAPGARFDVAALVFEDAPDAPGLDFGERYHRCDAYRSFAAKDGAGQESEIPNFKASYLGRFPLVSADFWTSDHLSERSRSVDAFSGTRARGTFTLKRR